MTLLRYQPLTLANQLHNEINRLFDQAGTGYDDAREVVSDWAPAVDIREENERFVLRADIPGVDPKDVEITMEDGALTLRGERHDEQRTSKEGYRRVERVSGKFFRRFTLPDGVDPEGVSARSNNGVLEITIPKLPQTQRRRVNVNID